MLFHCVTVISRFSWGSIVPKAAPSRRPATLVLKYLSENNTEMQAFFNVCKY